MLVSYERNFLDLLELFLNQGISYGTEDDFPLRISLNHNQEYTEIVITIMPPLGQWFCGLQRDHDYKITHQVYLRT